MGSLSENGNPGCRFFEGGGFPDSYGGNRFKTDFRVWLRYLWLMNLVEMEAGEKAAKAISLCYETVRPDTTPETLATGMAWFLECGEDDRRGLLVISEGLKKGIERENARRREEAPKFSYFWDFKEVWAAFYAKYGLDLYKVKHLHWWGFSALMAGAFADSPLGDLVRLRGESSKDINAMPKELQNGELIRQKLAAIPQERG